MSFLSHCKNTTYFVTPRSDGITAEYSKRISEEIIVRGIHLTKYYHHTKENLVAKKFITQ
jgi:hypothetical protein